MPPCFKTNINIIMALRVPLLSSGCPMYRPFSYRHVGTQRSKMMKKEKRFFSTSKTNIPKSVTFVCFSLGEQTKQNMCADEENESRTSFLQIALSLSEFLSLSFLLSLSPPSSQSETVYVCAWVCCNKHMVSNGREEDE